MMVQNPEPYSRTALSQREKGGERDARPCRSSATLSYCSHHNGDHPPTSPRAGRGRWATCRREPSRRAGHADTTPTRLAPHDSRSGAMGPGLRRAHQAGQVPAVSGVPDRDGGGRVSGSGSRHRVRCGRRHHQWWHRGAGRCGPGRTASAPRAPTSHQAPEHATPVTTGQTTWSQRRCGRAARICPAAYTGIGATALGPTIGIIEGPKWPVVDLQSIVGAPRMPVVGRWSTGNWPYR